MTYCFAESDEADASAAPTMAPSTCAVKYSTKRISVMRNVSNVAKIWIEVGAGERREGVDHNQDEDDVEEKLSARR